MHKAIPTTPTQSCVRRCLKMAYYPAQGKMEQKMEKWAGNNVTYLF